MTWSVHRQMSQTDSESAHQEVSVSPTFIGLIHVRLSVCSTYTLQPCFDPPKSKGTLAKDGKMYLKVITLRMMIRGGMRIQSGHAAVCACMKPPRRDECSGTPHWPVECDSLIGQGAFEFAGTMRDE